MLAEYALFSLRISKRVVAVALPQSIVHTFILSQQRVYGHNPLESEVTGWFHVLVPLLVALEERVVIFVRNYSFWSLVGGKRPLEEV